MDGRTVGRRADGWTDIQKDGWTNRQTDRQSGGEAYGWTDRQTDRQFDGQMDGQTDGQTKDVFYQVVRYYWFIPFALKRTNALTSCVERIAPAAAHYESVNCRAHLSKKERLMEKEDLQ